MTFEPVFLELDDLLEIHRDQLARYGGCSGVRDAGLLASALAAPQSGSDDQYFHPDIAAMAAAYLFHLVRNHPFVDGNKRAGAMASFVFLRMNSLDMRATESEFEKLVLDVAASRCEKQTVTEFMRHHVRKIRPRR